MVISRGKESSTSGSLERRREVSPNKECEVFFTEEDIAFRLDLMDDNWLCMRGSSLCFTEGVEWNDTMEGGAEGKSTFSLMGLKSRLVPEACGICIVTLGRDELTLCASCCADRKSVL